MDLHAEKVMMLFSVYLLSQRRQDGCSQTYQTVGLKVRPSDHQNECGRSSCKRGAESFMQKSIFIRLENYRIRNEIIVVAASLSQTNRILNRYLVS